MHVEVSTRTPPSARNLSSRGRQAKGLARPPASPRDLSLHKAGSVSATERTWALRFQQSHGRAGAQRRRAVVAFLVYKAVNKANSGKGGPRLAILMIRGPFDAADAGGVTKGLFKAPAALPHRPGWTVAFSALVMPPLPWTESRVLYFMVHLALSCTRPPPSSPCGIPSRQGIWGEEDQDIYKRRRRATEKRGIEGSTSEGFKT